MKISDFLKLLKKYPILIENEVIINEAIKELEELENRSCDNCKKRPSPFSECPCWSYSFGKANISLCSEWEAKNENL